MPAPAQAAGDGADGLDAQRIAPIVAFDYPAADRANPAIVAAFAALGPDDFSRRSHFIDGRFENLYCDADRLPGLAELLAFALRCAGRVLRDYGERWPIASEDDGNPGRPARLDPDSERRIGFWLNAMAPGQRTSRHSHDEADELVSGVYYVAAAPDSGAIRFHDGPFETRVEPVPGRMLLFPPALPHSVAPNRSAAPRLSVAFNIGPRRR